MDIHFTWRGAPWLTSVTTPLAAVMPRAPIAHVLAPLSTPSTVDRVLSLALGLGLCFLVLARLGRRCAVSALGVLATAAWLAVALQPSGTTRPDYRLRLAAPNPGAESTSPVEVHVCALAADGSAAPLPRPGRLLAVLLDDTPVATYGSAVFAERMPPGVHRLRVELVTARHRAFKPPLAVTVAVRANARRGPLAAPGRCPG
jgi:hypothetical protein